jgi:hypothetical protein
MYRLALLILLPLLCLPAADSGLAGRYTGDWKSNGAGGGGTFRMKLESASGGWKCEVSFAFDGADVKTAMRTCKVDQSKLEAVYDFELQGNALQSKITGQWNGKTFDGHYETTAGSDAVDDGTWTAAPAAGQ